MLKYVAALLLCASCSAQNLEPQPQRIDPAKQIAMRTTAVEREVARGSNFSDMEQQLHQVQIAQIVADRQAQLRRDTEKLVALTAELKENVAKTGPNILSMDVIKKAGEIQKLAKSVEEKMKKAY